MPDSSSKNERHGHIQWECDTFYVFLNKVQRQHLTTDLHEVRYEIQWIDDYKQRHSCQYNQTDQEWHYRQYTTIQHRNSTTDNIQHRNSITKSEMKSDEEITINLVIAVNKLRFYRNSSVNNTQHRNGIMNNTQHRNELK